MTMLIIFSIIIITTYLVVIVFFVIARKLPQVIGVYEYFNGDKMSFLLKIIIESYV